MASWETQFETFVSLVRQGIANYWKPTDADEGDLREDIAKLKKRLELAYRDRDDAKVELRSRTLDNGYKLMAAQAELEAMTAERDALAKELRDVAAERDRFKLDVEHLRPLMMSTHRQLQNAHDAYELLQHALYPNLPPPRGMMRPMPT